MSIWGTPQLSGPMWWSACVWVSVACVCGAVSLCGSVFLHAVWQLPITAAGSSSRRVGRHLGGRGCVTWATSVTTWRPTRPPRFRPPDPLTPAAPAPHPTTRQQHQWAIPTRGLAAAMGGRAIRGAPHRGMAGGITPTLQAPPLPCPLNPHTTSKPASLPRCWHLVLYGRPTTAATTPFTAWLNTYMCGEGGGWGIIRLMILVMMLILSGCSRSCTACGLTSLVLLHSKGACH